MEGGFTDGLSLREILAGCAALGAALGAAIAAYGAGKRRRGLDEAGLGADLESAAHEHEQTREAIRQVLQVMHEERLESRSRQEAMLGMLRSEGRDQRAAIYAVASQIVVLGEKIATKIAELDRDVGILVDRGNLAHQRRAGDRG